MKEYPREYKIESVRFYLRNGKLKHKAARELGIPPSTLRGWIKKYMSEVTSKPNEKPSKRDFEKELEEKDKRIQRLEEENAILKKSIGIFTRDSLQK
jgi:transposase-like protein